METKISIAEAITPLLRDPRVLDICLNGAKLWHVDRGQGLECIEISNNFSDYEFKTWVLEQISSSGKAWDAKFPFLDLQLFGTHRAHILFPPIYPHGILVSLRRLPTPDISNNGKTRWQHCLSEFLLLEKAVLAKESILICGATGSGKTTLLNDLVRTCAKNDRIIALEDTPELCPGHPHFLSLLSRAPNADGFGAISLRELLRQTLRMRPDRIILGECRGEEVMDLLQALNTGHRGTLATVHANSPRDGLRRVELLALLSARGSIPISVIRELIAVGIQWVVYTEKRSIASLSHIEGKEGDTILARPIVSKAVSAAQEPF